MSEISSPLTVNQAERLHLTARFSKHRLLSCLPCSSLCRTGKLTWLRPNQRRIRAITLCLRRVRREDLSRALCSSRTRRRRRTVLRVLRKCFLLQCSLARNIFLCRRISQSCCDSSSLQHPSPSRSPPESTSAVGPAKLPLAAVHISDTRLIPTPSLLAPPERVGLSKTAPRRHLFGLKMVSLGTFRTVLPPSMCSMVASATYIPSRSSARGCDNMVYFVRTGEEKCISQAGKATRASRGPRSTLVGVVLPPLSCPVGVWQISFPRRRGVNERGKRIILYYNIV
jgi:hypothetical protein